MLNEQKCEACSIDAIALSKDEQQSLLLELSDWQIMERDGIPQLRRCSSLRTTNKHGRSATKCQSWQKKNSITLRFYWSGAKSPSLGGATQSKAYTRMTLSAPHAAMFLR